jgi:tRNA pseudouridine38-40 synthase
VKENLPRQHHVNTKLTLEYDGTRYHGWQIQANGETIQAVIERAISTFAGETIRVTGSGRTDAGVHALGQVVNFKCGRDLDLRKLLRGLNALTPPDISVIDAVSVPDSFDARRDACSRIYEYRILNRAIPSPFLLNRAWHVHEALEIESIAAAIRSLEGEHDFSSFQAAGCDAAHAVRTVYLASLARRGELLVVTIEATAFLRHMVRNIAGTLVEVGRGVRSVGGFKELLELRDRVKAGPTAPPYGLYLLEVKY